VLDGLFLPWRASSGSWSAGFEAQGKPEGGPFHPGGHRRGKIGRANTCEPLVDASLSADPARWDVGAGCRDMPLRCGRRRPGSGPGRDEHRCPRGTEGAHPDRSSCVRNVVTPSGSGPRSGKPTARRAQLPGGNRMTEKRNAGGRKMSCPGVFPGSARELAAGRWPGPSCRTAWVGARGLQPRGRPFNRRHPTADQRIEGSEVGGCVRGGLADVDRDGC
jgi:hypothetical protein